ncbi:hypothetical protein GCM10023188_22330 [Pontibacter saemangeumensis]|uniref:Uncharacterized protein n=1 Tax=Pontibacter saemangeumensis TaxID=1084525 RepID=A0ABP8LQ22_9BACT
MTKLKLLSHYYRSILSFNLPFSLLVATLSIPLRENGAIGLMNTFSLFLTTGDFLVALYLYEQRYSGQYYFYHNQGLGRVQLAVAALVANLLLVVLLYLLRAILLHG